MEDKGLRIVEEPVEAVSRSDTDKEGNPLKDKLGKNYTRVGVKLDDNLIDDPEWQGWVNMADYKNIYADIEKGGTITGIIDKRIVNYPNTGRRVFWNFRYPSRVDDLEERVEALENSFELLAGGKPKKVEKEPEPEEEEPEEDYPDLPF